MRTDAQKRADYKYKKDNTTEVRFRIYPSEKDILEWLSRKQPIATYIKSLIRQDMKKEDIK